MEQVIKEESRENSFPAFFVEYEESGHYVFVEFLIQDHCKFGHEN